MKGLRENLGTLWRGLALVASAAPWTAALYLVMMTVLSLLPVLQVWLVKLVVDELTLAASGVAEAVMTAMALAGVYALTLIVNDALQPLQQTMNARLEDRTVAMVDRQLMQAGERLVDLVQIERPAFQDKRHMAQEAAGWPPRLFEFMQQGPAKVLTLAGLLLLLGQLHPLLPFILATFTVPQLLVERGLNQRRYEVMAQHSRAAREMDYCARVTTDPIAAKEVRVFGLGSFFLRRYQERFVQALTEINRVRLSQLRASGLFGTLYALALGGGFWYVAMRAGAGQLTLGDVALYLGAVQQAQSRLADLPMWFSHMHQAVLYLRRLFDFLDAAQPAIQSASGEKQQAPAGLQSGIVLREVRFGYPESTGDVLKNISMTLPAGKVTALVGVNGAGKSTLVKLLTRMYDPDKGEILLDGVPLWKYDLGSLRTRIAVVYQDFARFALTLRENVAVGAVEPGRDDGFVQIAARWAGADEVAMKLPQGYDTQLTRRFEGGMELSGGEWQKVALARSFMRDAALVILDEPTAALDADAEYRLFERFGELMAGKTALIISHRFSTVKMADQILVLEDGHIIEAGSHAKLLAQNGLYAALFEMQAGRYR